MARKFNIGDTVQVVKGACIIFDFNVGHRGKVTKFNGCWNFPYEVVRKNGVCADFSARELKLIKRKK